MLPLKLILTFCFITASAIWSLATNKNLQEIYLNGFYSSNKHLRAAVSYLRTGNTDIAALELEAFNDKWKLLEKQLDNPNSNLTTVLIAGRKTGSDALELIDSNSPKLARKKLLELRRLLFNYNNSAGISTFDDCIYSANIAGQELWKYRRPRPDLSDEKVRAALLSISKKYESLLKQCDHQADASIKQKSEYMRLIRNALESLEKVPQTIVNKDGGQLFRYLIELRSLDQLLYLRFG